MAKAVEIRPLREADDRTEFSCGQDDLDRFFRHYAGQNQFKFHLAMNYVAVADDSIVGFATVTVAAVERSGSLSPRSAALGWRPSQNDSRWTPRLRLIDVIGPYGGSP